ncbi:MAG: hypothetical protein LH606_13140 [Cytophagaceae bacterium]|nr:hypothetical protein [Cytophagaceae bacterium]
MRTCLLLLLGVLSGLASSGQPAHHPRFDTTRASLVYWNKWYDDLTQPGVKLDKDSLKISEEVRHIARDPEYRKSLYPTEFTWPPTLAYLKQMELKKAFWFMINLYPTTPKNEELVLQTVFAYEKAMDMKKVMTSAFYTYALLDPKVCVLKDGKPNSTRPDLLEGKLRYLQEIVVYIRAFRADNEKKQTAAAPKATAKNQPAKRN